MHYFEACPKICFGEDALNYLDSIKDEKICVIADPFMVSSGIAQDVTKVFREKGYAYTIFSDVEPDPSIATISRGVHHIFQEKPDVVIALGGGSAIDAAKAILYFCTRLKGQMMDEKYIHKPFFIAIPTTSGTGSEVTSYAVVTDPLNNVKIPISAKRMIPDVAILWPQFTKTLPLAIVANTGMDVLTHAVEAFVSKNANPFSDMYAKEAAQKVFKYLIPLYENLNNTSLREEMYIASTMAGLAFTNSGLGINHSIAHTIGADFHIPHGLANSIVLPYVIAYNAGLTKYVANGVHEKYGVLARFMGLPLADDVAACKGLVMAVQAFNQKFGIKQALKEHGIDPTTFADRLDVSADKILADMCTSANPVDISKESLKGLLMDIYEGNGIML